MKYFIIKIGIVILNGIYAVMKCFLPVQKKIVYISRQSNSIPLDFILIKRQMEKKYPQYSNIFLVKYLEKGIKAKLEYALHIFKQMYHICTASAVILDTYCIPVSILRQRKSLVVIQMWHALGAFKKFGCSIWDKKEGSSARLAQVMKMHENYSYVLTSSEYCKAFFADAFRQDLRKVKVLPLPRVDLLRDEQWKKDTRRTVYEAYPCLKNGKKVIVYAPTFRKGTNGLREGIEKLLDVVDYDKYELVLKVHPLYEEEIEDTRAIVDQVFSTQEMFNVADYIVTDYSAVIFEAAILHKPMFFYAFDYQEYVSGRDFYFDYFSTVPGIVSEKAEDIVEAIEHENYSLDLVEEFKELMVELDDRSCTEKLCDFVNELIN